VEGGLTQQENLRTVAPVESRQPGGFKKEEKGQGNDMTPRAPRKAKGERRSREEREKGRGINEPFERNEQGRNQPYSSTELGGRTKSRVLT